MEAQRCGPPWFKLADLVLTIGVRRASLGGHHVHLLNGSGGRHYFIRRAPVLPVRSFPILSPVLGTVI
jgi:hypothetical protein